MKIRKFNSGDKERLSQLACDTSVTRNMALADDILTEEGVTRPRYKEQIILFKRSKNRAD